MASILSLETSGDCCSVALHIRGAAVAVRHIREPQVHASRLSPLIDEVMRDTRTAYTELTAVAITSGPGSYTGLRIGTSTAKGLCYALNVPLISVGTLELMTYQASKQEVDSWLCAMIDARRMEVYSLVTDVQGRVAKPVEAEVIDENSFRAILEKQPVTFFGNGAAKCKTVITHPAAHFLDGIEAEAGDLGELAWRKFEAQQFEDLVHFEPYYLKEFQIKKSTRPLF